jgi:hypothetical protein
MDALSCLFAQIDVPVDTVDSAVVSTVLSALADSALPWLAKHRAMALEIVADEPEPTETEPDTATVTDATAAATDDSTTDDTTAGHDDDSTAAAAASAAQAEQKHQQLLLDRAAKCGAGAAQAALAVNTFRAASALLEAPAHAATFVNSSSSSSSSTSGSSWLCELVRAAAAPSPNGSNLAQLDTLESSWRELWSRWHNDSQRWCSSDRDAPPAATTETASDTAAADAAAAAAGTGGRSSSRANAAAGSSGSSSGAGSSMAATLAAALDAERRAMSALDAAGARGSSGYSHYRYAEEEVSALLAEQQQQQQSVSVSASSLSAYISATAAAMGAGTVVLDISAAVAQLIEMGFQREWAEVALRYTELSSNTNVTDVRLFMLHSVDSVPLIW